jgi:hypothetical protein
MQWLRDRQNQNDSSSKSWSQSSCPASKEVDLVAAPWRMTEDLLVWYAELAGLQLRSTNVDGSGRTQSPIRVPNGAAQIALIGLKSSSGATVKFSSATCEQGAGKTFKSFTYQPVQSKLVDGERCAGGSIDGAGLVPNQNSLYALLIPENQELAACTPNPDGGGTFMLRPGFASLLSFNPRVVWVGPKGEIVDPELKPEQLLEDGLTLSEDQASKLTALGGNWRIALDFSKGITQPGKEEAYSLLYDSVLLRNGDASTYAARRPISATVHGSPCAPLFERSLLQKYLLLYCGIIALIALVFFKRLYDSKRIDLAGDLAILDSTGSKSVDSSPISGGSPSWFNVGDRGKIEPGKGEDGKNWRLRWRGGTNISLEPTEGEVGDWSEGTVKSERGRGFIEFKRVPLVGGSDTNTIRYTPEEGTKMGELIRKELEDLE